MRPLTLQEQLSTAESRLRAMQEELAETNRGLVALTMELEKRVEERTSELKAAHVELKNTNSDLMQLTLELEDRVASRTKELAAAIETHKSSRIAALNLMEDAVIARTEVERVNTALNEENSQRTKAEREIRELNAELEQRVRDRTSQLEAANKELEAFSYSVSHDLRAPLRSIDGFSQIVLEDYADKLDDEGKRFLNVIRSSTQKMGELITDMLDLSRVTRNEMRTTLVNMTSLAKSTYDDIAPVEVQNGYTFSIGLLPKAYCDLALMKQVWTNLISNAIKFTAKKDFRRIDIEGRSENGVHVYTIKDTGAGFDPRYTNKLFGVFQRLHKSEEFEGTGVGLAIVQRIIHRHGGRVWAEAVVGQGASFHFSLPIKETSRGKQQ